MASAKWRPSCVGINVLRLLHVSQIGPMGMIESADTVCMYSTKFVITVPADVLLAHNDSRQSADIDGYRDYSDFQKMFFAMGELESTFTRLRQMIADISENLASLRLFGRGYDFGKMTHKHSYRYPWLITGSHNWFKDIRDSTVYDHK